MSFIPYKFFIYLNFVLGLLLVALPLILSSNTMSANIYLSLIGLIISLSVLAGNTKEFKIKTKEFIPKKILLVIIFICSIILNFLPYILNFTNQPKLLTTIFVISGISLMSLIFSKLDTNETK